jgi:hypothetical protein
MWGQQELRSTTWRRCKGQSARCWTTVSPSMQESPETFQNCVDPALKQLGRFAWSILYLQLVYGCTLPLSAACYNDSNNNGVIYRVNGHTHAGLLVVQERERRKESWAPRWFRPSKDATVYPAEYSLEECPMWEFTGDYLKLPRTPAKAGGTCSPLSPAHCCGLQQMVQTKHGCVCRDQGDVPWGVHHTSYKGL